MGVTGTGSLIGQSIIKSILKSNLLKNKIDIIGFDYFKETVGSFWCKKKLSIAWHFGHQRYRIRLYTINYT